MNELLKMEFEEIEDILERAELTETFTDDRFKIRDLDAANWAFRKLKAMDEKVKQVTDLASKEIERILEWKENELKQVGRSREFFEGLLIEYFVRQKEMDPKFKISTPYGKVSSRKSQPKWNYEDDRVLKWLKENDKELIRTKEEINKAELKKKYRVMNGQVVTEDGEIVEGITVAEQPDSISIKVVE